MLFTPSTKPSGAINGFTGAPVQHDVGGGPRRRPRWPAYRADRAATSAGTSWGRRRGSSGHRASPAPDAGPPGTQGMASGLRPPAAWLCCTWWRGQCVVWRVSCTPAVGAAPAPAGWCRPPPPPASGRTPPPGAPQCTPTPPGAPHAAAKVPRTPPPPPADLIEEPGWTTLCARCLSISSE